MSRIKEHSLDNVNILAALNHRDAKRRYNRLNIVHRERIYNFFSIDDIGFSIPVSVTLNKRNDTISVSSCLRSGKNKFHLSKNKSLNNISHAVDVYIKHNLHLG